MRRFLIASLLTLSVIMMAACGGSSSSATGAATTTTPGATASATSASGGASPTNTPTSGGASPTNTPTSGGASPTNTPTSGGVSPTNTPNPTATPPNPYTPYSIVHVATASNVHSTSHNLSLDTTYISEINNVAYFTSGSELWVTPNYTYNNNHIYDTHPIGVFYDAGVNEWGIFHEDLTPMTIGEAFNVIVVFVPSHGGELVVTANSGNIGGDSVNVSAVPSSAAWLTVTPVWNPGGVGGTYTHSPIGVYYNGTNWAIFHEDHSAMTAGESFFIYLGPNHVAQATASNSFGDSFGATSDPASAILVVTPDWTYHSNNIYETSPLGVYYYNGQWRVFLENASTMPVNFAVNIFE